ncbi:GlsB/YeaQ/YmgE family stress response membrane protein [Erythrobacter sp. EC-HK427]|uniref:GlsB/YeaQ/YmgE family stress response membrane protein n=1 Tax=Erythrobacter sp. EC-HK427 TaxID=2038396 RepID=UPI0012566935|nr:GlsB/YeaQ/YmgE family stress response membrane protein [Erythrobacter sp. EC-HK427]VVT04023.1 Transglycosylase associated protein [Erythrobacter sp. EC-HK427]
MGWIATIILGGIAGWLASKVMGRDASMGILLNIVVGVIGGLIGSFIGNYTGFLTDDAGWIMYLVTATIGAVVLLGIINLVQRGKVR